MATPTEEAIAAALAAMNANLAAGGIAGFRENEDSAEFHGPDKYARLLQTLARTDVQAALDNAGKASPPVFSFPCF